MGFSLRRASARLSWAQTHGDTFLTAGRLSTALFILFASLPSATAEYAGNVVGRVQDGASGRPIAGAAIAVIGNSPAESRRGHTDANGRFLINAVSVEYPSSTYSVVATAPGYRAQVLKDVRVLPGAVMALECAFVLSRPGAAARFAPAGASFLYSHERVRTTSRSVQGGQIFATREGLVGRTTANGHVIRRSDRFVALPSRRALNRKGERTFQVRVRYGRRSVTAPVWDVGPWNIRDDYWNPPAQRESWRNLPHGLPEAQAAYLNGFNSGRDGFGRKVLNPAGIDLSDALFRDALGMRDNDWVTVEYLWDTRLISSRDPASSGRRAPEARTRTPRRRSIEELIALAEAIILRRPW